MKSHYINRKKLLNSIEREVSRVAATAFAEDGTSLYDAIIITSRDEEVVKEMIDDAKSALVTRLSDIATMSSDLLEFDVPDSRTHDITVIGSAIDRFIVVNVCSAWMIQKHKDKAEEYGARATDAINKVERLLYERLPPIPPVHIEN